MHLGSREHLTIQRRDRRAQQRTALTDPAGPRRPFQVNALAGIDVALPIERQMIPIFGHENVRQQTGTGRAFGNGRLGAAA